MKRSGSVWALAALLASNVVLAVLLSPLGFESRPPSDLKVAGYLAIGTVFAGVITDLVALVLVFSRARVASILAIIGSVLFLFPDIVDRTGSFFSLPIPPVVNVLEYLFAAVIVVTLFMALRVYRESTPASG